MKRFRIRISVDISSSFYKESNFEILMNYWTCGLRMLER